MKLLLRFCSLYPGWVGFYLLQRSVRYDVWPTYYRAGVKTYRSFCASTAGQPTVIQLSLGTSIGLLFRDFSSGRKEISHFYWCCY